MKINDKEINLKITPKAIKIVEERDKNFDILKLIREATNDGIEPRISDHYKVIYVGYIGATNEDILFEDFLEMIKDIDILEINSTAIDLLIERKN